MVNQSALNHIVRIARRSFQRHLSMLIVTRQPVLRQIINIHGPLSSNCPGVRHLLSRRALSMTDDRVEKSGEQLTRRKFESEQSETFETPLAASERETKSTWLGEKWENVMGKIGLKVDRTRSQEEQNAQKRKRSTVLATVFLGGGVFCGFLYFCIYYGWMRKEGEYSGILAPYHRIRTAYKSWKDFVIEPSREKLLPEPFAPPYHQPKYTLVIEMMNVLVAPEWSYKTGNRLIKRPALDYFLDLVGYPNFEVVIYTSENGLTANPVVDAIDSKQRIMYRLYRDCTKYMNGHYVKDLSRLNRDLSKVIYIDFDPNSFQLNPESVLRVPKWNGSLNDTALVDLAELLKTIHLSDVEDVRPTLQYYSQFDDPLREFRNRATHIAELEKKQEDMETKKLASHAPVKQYQGRLFGFRRHE